MWWIWGWLQAYAHWSSCLRRRRHCGKFKNYARLLPLNAGTAARWRTSDGTATIRPACLLLLLGRISTRGKKKAGIVVLCCLTLSPLRFTLSSATASGAPVPTTPCHPFRPSSMGSDRCSDGGSGGGDAIVSRRLDR